MHSATAPRSSYATAAVCNRDSSQILAALMDSDSSQQDGLAGWIILLSDADKWRELYSF